MDELVSVQRSMNLHYLVLGEDATLTDDGSARFYAWQGTSFASVDELPDGIGS